MVKASKKDFKAGFVAGLGWAFGVTLGFAIISTILVLFLNKLTGLPWIGESLKPIVERTETTLEKRSPIVPSSAE